MACGVESVRAESASPFFRLKAEATRRMGAVKAPTTLELIWQQELVFHGQSGDARIVLDSAGKAGPSPVQTLAFAVAGCMGMDVVHILKKGRHDLQALRVLLTAERAQQDPHRVTAVTIAFEVTGP